jgi:hypothetical protein
MTFRIRRALALVTFTAAVSLAPAARLAAMQTTADVFPQAETKPDKAGKTTAIASDTQAELRHALIRLPLAALLGATLAMRPRRKGTPPRQAPVIQTQIILGIVGALVMLVVGTNLARAFGVVGAAGLVRYRAKVEDPKDAGVMLSTLAIGLSSGVGLYVLAVFSAAFILLALWVIESFEPATKKLFDLKIKMGDDTDERRQEFDKVLNKFHVDFVLLSSSDEEVCYELSLPLDLDRDRLTNALLKLDPDGHGAVEWTEKKPKTK